LEIEELDGLDVNVDDVIYMPSLEAPTDRPHPFVYFVTIRNESDEAVTIRGRKWVLTQASGEMVIVEGDGVVGQFPKLEVGADFSYNSYHVIGQDSAVEGAFFAETEQGRPVFAKIPGFDLKVPEWA
jgi:ApaG protein